ncbi:MAG: helix-turn-helix domain-containing protein, partial [Eubacteriales bacterium]
LKQASLMLLNTDLPVSQIAEKAGFSNHSNFIKSFKSVYQLLPKDFRLNK